MAKRPVKNAEIKKRGVSLGTDEGDHIVDRALADDDRLKLSNDNGPNVFLLLHSDAFALSEHFVRKADNSIVRTYCGVHKEGDFRAILDTARWAVPENCEMCKRVVELRQRAKDDKKGGDKIREIARDVGCAVSALLVAAPADYESRKVGAKKRIIPFCDSPASYGLLSLTYAAFSFFWQEFKEQGFNANDLRKGLFVNFERGYKTRKGGGKSKWSQVIGVEFFKSSIPANKLPKLPDAIDFSKYGDYGDYREEAMKETCEVFDASLASKLSGTSARRSGSRATTSKKRPSKKAPRRR